MLPTILIRYNAQLKLVIGNIILKCCIIFVYENIINTTIRLSGKGNKLLYFKNFTLLLELHKIFDAETGLEICIRPKVIEISYFSTCLAFALTFCLLGCKSMYFSLNFFIHFGRLKSKDSEISYFSIFSHALAMTFFVSVRYITL